MTSNVPAVGIDLGTTFSLVAHLDPAGRPRSLVNCEGDLLTPSVVLFDRSSMIVGKEAVRAAALEPDRIADFAKREMGNSVYSRPIAGKRYPPEVIQAMILEKLKQDAELHIGPFEKVVVTVPAFFNEPRRKATQDAGKLAGLDVIDIINEPTAAAIAFGYQCGFLAPGATARQAEKILVYDLGGGTFDVTIMEIEGRNFTAIATGGDVMLGGGDWDQRLIDYIATLFMEKHHGLDPRSDPAGMARLKRDAEDVKRALSAREQTMLSYEHSGLSVRMPIARAKFEEVTLDLLERTRFTMRSVLHEAGLQWDDITRVLLVGGSTRMPMVARLIEEESGRTPDRSVAADEAVAHGAAIYAGLLLSTSSGQRPTMRVTNVSSHDLGVLGIESSTKRPKNSVIIPRNTPLPATETKSYRTAKEGQRSVVINVIEGGDIAGNNSTPIGRCVVHGLPRNLPARTKVRVQFNYDASGRLAVTASIDGTNASATLDIERASGMTDANLKDWSQRLRDNRPLILETDLQDQTLDFESEKDE